MSGILIGRRDTKRQRKGPVMTEAEIGEMRLHPKGCQGLLEPPEARRGMEQFVLRAFNGTNPAVTSISGILNCGRILDDCFKISNLWQFVKATPGNSHT